MGLNMQGSFSFNLGGGDLFGGPGGLNNFMPTGGPGGLANLLPTGNIGGQQRSQLLGALADLFKAFGSFFGGGGQGCGQPGQVSPPSPDDCFPSGSGGLKKDSSGCVTTPGGYKIRSTGQYNWEIECPNGKKSSISGDPHWEDGDGTKFDTKEDATVMLPDGTKLDLACADLGNGTSVSKDLTITNGNDRVQITGMDKGKGQTGEITKDGFDHVNDFAAKQVFVMSKDGTDFYKDGKEILGNENGADTFKLGQQNPDIQNPGQMNDLSQLLMQLFQMLFGGQGLGQQGGADAAGGNNPAGAPNANNQQDLGNVNGQPDAAEQMGRPQGQNGLQNMLKSLIQMLQILARLASLFQQFNGARPQPANA